MDGEEREQSRAGKSRAEADTTYTEVLVLVPVQQNEAGVNSWHRWLVYERAGGRSAASTGGGH